MLGIACGILHWAPDRFWESTPHELFAAISGWNRAHDPNRESEKREAFASFKEEVETALGHGRSGTKGMLR